MGCAGLSWICINLGESASFRGEKFFKNLPHLPRSKLGRKRSSFEVRGSLGFQFCRASAALAAFWGTHPCSVVGVSR